MLLAETDGTKQLAQFDGCCEVIDQFFNIPSLANLGCELHIKLFL